MTLKSKQNEFKKKDISVFKTLKNTAAPDHRSTYIYTICLIHLIFFVSVSSYNADMNTVFTAAKLNLSNVGCVIQSVVNFFFFFIGP